MPTVELDETKVKFVDVTNNGLRPMTPHEVNTLLMRLMGIPKRNQAAYRKANKLA